MRRILILGCSGAGKSTLARRLGERLGLPVVHLDREYWRPGWRSISDDEFDRRVADVIERPEWIIDGNFSRTLPLRLSRADTAVHLDLPRWRCLWRITKRVSSSTVFGHPRPDNADGCPERWDWEFVEWVWDFRAQVRPPTVEALERHAGTVRVVTLTTPTEVERFLSALPGATTAGGG